VITAVRENHLEGIVAKRAQSAHEPDQRSGAWVKFKLGYEQAFVIGGYTRGKGNRSDFGALIVGYYQGAKLVYASKVGTGFSNAVIRQFIEQTKPLRQPQSPFDAMPESRRSRWGYGLTADERKTAAWLKPVLVCQVRFTEWTNDGHLRHPAFLGFRDDRHALQVVREK
jgi:bifunctional non-homologous end joining protein LigD